MVPVPRNGGVDGPWSGRALPDLQQRLHVARPRRRIDCGGARDHSGVDGTRHAGGGDARRQHPAADRGDAGGGRHGDRETRSRQRRKPAHARPHPAVANRTMSEEIRRAATSTVHVTCWKLKILLQQYLPKAAMDCMAWSVMPTEPWTMPVATQNKITRS